MMASGEAEPPPAVNLFGVDLLDVDEGRTVLSFKPAPAFGNQRTTVHGGVLAGVADFAIVTAVWTLLPASTVVSTADLHLSYLRAVGLEDEELVCTGEVIHCGRSQATGVAQLVGADGRLHLHAVATCRFELIDPALL
jgi:uncharacterized protein (TIGR00369 family)